MKRRVCDIGLRVFWIVAAALDVCCRAQVVWRGLLILFGGFHDTGRDTRYYNDLYIFSFSENKFAQRHNSCHPFIQCSLLRYKPASD